MKEKPGPFLADVMCQRYAKANNIPIGVKYWNNAEWKIRYKKEILAAARLLKIYPFEVICSAINNKKISWVYTLYFPGLKQVLEEEFAKYERNRMIEEKRLEKEKSSQDEVKRESKEEAPTILGQSKSLKNFLD